VVICDSGIIAGIEHVESILLETKEHWKRNEKLVRNGSIEILMRLTCKSQITEAIEASGIKEANSVALLGLLSSENDVKKTVNEFMSEVETTGQDLKFLEIDRQKASKLKRLHKLPNNLTKDQLQIALQEKSVLLIFSK
jgi:tRNA threonylcarbamoyladenosine modification (KEOPS) complex Cgi121 subunit